MQQSAHERGKVKMARKILVVDDQENIARIVRMMLENKGYTTIWAGDGAEALRLAKTEEPDLILLDVMLPKIDGFKVCRLLKFDKKYSHIPIVLLTAKSSPGDKQTGREVGADYYLEKPFQPVQLIQVIEQLLSLEGVQ
jgi:two-component system, OmpR family, alkaline phosphatase synthesis response regulator PhoP